MLGRPLTRYQALTATTAIATLILIGIGALVRTTGSGLGCPDWPLCHGELIPPAEKTAIIEYSHRTWAAAVGALVVAVAALTFLHHRGDRALRWMVLITLPLLALQGWLGKETVERELPAEVVAIHMGTALILLALLSLIAAFAFLGPRRRRIDTPERRTFVRIALGSAAVTYGVLLVGAYVVGADATTACLSWPGCEQAPIPFVDGVTEQHVHWSHRLTVVLGLFAALAVPLATVTMRAAGPMLRNAAWGVFALYVAQIIVGASNIWTDFSEASRVAHLALGSAIWALLVLVAIAGAFSPSPATETPRPAREIGGQRDRTGDEQTAHV